VGVENSLAVVVKHGDVLVGFFFFFGVVKVLAPDFFYFPF